MQEKRGLLLRAIRVVIALTEMIPAAHATPAYFSTVANRVLRLQGGARLTEAGGGDLKVQAVVELEKQVKRVMGADPAAELNVSALRDRPDTELLRILFLAVLGNFTSAAGTEWNRPCSLVVDPESGRVALENQPPLASLALKVVLVLLVAVQIKQWVSDTNTLRGGAPEPPERLPPQIKGR